MVSTEEIIENFPEEVMCDLFSRIVVLIVSLANKHVCVCMCVCETR